MDGVPTPLRCFSECHSAEMFADDGVETVTSVEQVSGLALLGNVANANSPSTSNGGWKSEIFNCHTLNYSQSRLEERLEMSLRSFAGSALANLNEQALVHR